MMLNKYQNYLQQHQNQHQQIVQQQQRGDITTSMAESVGDAGLSDYGAMASNISKSERESIHSGQFMVSHFEAEEAQEDDLEEDGQVLDPEEINLTKPEDVENTCTDVQRFVPRKISYVQELGQEGSVVASHLEIETSLTKLFKCMNLAYSQKLTSPKWNHFKGIRLRWKDKIRLNNVIWRCWHMQFILKRRTPVCQFASPLDVDIHSNPQAVVLEGKYWKRQTTVIKAEYRKWRKNSKSKTAGSLTYDTKSEFDFLEWSPLNDRMLMIPDDWTNDTLFSSINGPFPFPDPREIARGAGIADFIQPGLGSLQPNIDDIDLTIDALFFSELLQPNRLPPVPEEGTDEMLKNVEYNLSAIMGSDQLESNSMVGGNNSNTLPVNDDANMLDLNAPLDSIQFQSSMVQRYPTPLSRENSNSQLMNTSGSNQAQTINSVDAIMTDDQTGTVSVNDGLGSPASATSASSSMRIHSKHFPATNEGVSNNRSTGNEFPSKSVMKGRISKNSQRIFRREPHNYDKAQPTLHQTSMYHQMLAEHQKSQQNQHLQPTLSCTALQHHSMTYHQQQQQQQQQQMQSAVTQYPTGTGDGGSGAVYGGYGSVDISSASANSGLNVNNNLLNVSMVNQKPKGYAIIQTTTNCMPNATQINANNSPHTGNTSVLLQTVKTEPPSTDMLSMYNLSASNDVYGINTNLSGNNNSNAYKPYPSVSNFKKSASTGGYINVRLNANSPYMHDQTTNAQQLHQQSLPPNLGCQVTSLPSPLQLQVQAQCQLSPSSSHQHQQQPQQCAQHLLTTQQQHQMQQLSQQQQQQQQQQQSSVNMMPREMIRSNSLPLNVTLQKLESRSSHDNFVVPKYQAKNNKPRSRSNSIHQHSLVAPSGANKASSATNSNLMVSPQLQSAISDPMLNNSTLAQLLTTSSRSLLKKQSSSSSAISNINVPMPAISMPAVVVPPPASSTITVNTNKSQNIGNTSTSANYFATSTNASGTSADSSYTRHSMQMHQEQLQKSPKKCTSLPTPAAPQMLHSPPCSKMLSYPPTASQAAMCTNTLSLSPESFHDQDSPLSPTHSLKFPRDNQRRAGHIHAEQKRRYNIKNGFDLLHSLIPQLQQNPNAKLSKAAMLQKGADHIKHLRSERNQLKDHMEALLKERDILNNSLTHLHSILPANGAPVTRQGTEHVRQLYDQYVRHRTMQDWKFWILGLILEPLLTSYTASVSSASLEELRRTAFLWVDQHCSLIDLRPAVSNKLKYLSMKTDILSDPPSTLKDEVAKAVYNSSGHHPNLHGT